MGCDIHMFGEVRDKKTGKWVSTDVWKPSKYEDDEGRLTIPYHQRIYTHRNYNLFAWLADVRNGTWGEHIPPIADPKGLPEDASPEVANEAERWNGDGHSHSYFTLAELEEAWEVVKDTPIWFEGAVSPDNPDPKFQEWLSKPAEERGAPPGGYCAWGTGCVPMKWVEPLHELIGTAYGQIQDYLSRLKIEESVGDEDVRVVFWFDN